MFVCDARSTQSISSPCYKRFISINWWVSTSTSCLNIRFTRSWPASSVIISYWQSIMFTHKTRWSVAVKSVVRLQLSSNHFFWAPLYFFSKACFLPIVYILWQWSIDTPLHFMHRLYLMFCLYLFIWISMKFPSWINKVSLDSSTHSLSIKLFI